jgi:hypothetical protein
VNKDGSSRIIHLNFPLLHSLSENTVNMQLSNLLSLILAITAAQAALNEPCVGSSGAPGKPPPTENRFHSSPQLTLPTPGVCVKSADCKAAGGTSISGACPSDPADVKCCSKPTCGKGNCRWTSDCPGESVAGQCPGPSSFKCCQSSANGFGGYKVPSFPAVGACKQVSVDGSKRIVAAFPGRVHQVYCTRDCKCGSGSDHCCGKASDIMCSDNGGVSSPIPFLSSFPNMRSKADG